MTLSLDDVRNKRFRMARKSGYEVLEVDEFVDEVERMGGAFTESDERHDAAAGEDELSQRRQGLLETVRCLDPHEGLSPGQREAIDRVYEQYPDLNDDAFVEEHRDEWLKP